MNYVWARREMEEHRGSSETVAVPFLDLEETEQRDRGFKRQKCDGGGREDLEPDGETAIILLMYHTQTVTVWLLFQPVHRRDERLRLGRSQRTFSHRLLFLSGRKRYLQQLCSAAAFLLTYYLRTGASLNATQTVNNQSQIEVCCISGG